ncbi:MULTISPECIES: peptidoglycan DD-metalloendopeptidase family protein [Gordonia]|uniref:peptidoglycan DD-metalloendopeptidase family protein n=1 Tax=Gordonia TaxID=2053 RepID=UPI00257CE215|nr:MULTISPECIES: peptidoglycan DD-metalloendopeptidase family protein [Gordonia]
MLRVYPLCKADFTISSGYGPRDGGFHYGLDFAAKDGTPFYACQSGTVQYIGAADGYGQWIVIDSDDSEGGGCLEYGHMWNAFATGLAVGSHVTAGQLIGYVGANGQASGPHLHLAVHTFNYRSAYTDPAKWLAGSGYPGAPAPTPTPSGGTAVADRPAFREIDMMGNNRSNRWGAKIVYWLLHTEEGNSTAVQLANSLNNRDDASYHYVGRDSIVCDVVDTDYGSWSVLDANNRSINYCFAGSRASMSRQEWLNRYRNDIRIAAYLAVQDARKYNAAMLTVQGRPYPLGNRPCIADHNFVTVVLGIGSHTDCGPNFPWDVLASDVKTYATGAPVTPPVNQINLEADRAKNWIGKRLDPIGATDEHPTPDGRGKWVKFENGYIYWTPTTGAHAIPTFIFETWAGLKWERGPLGYPTGDHTVLKDGVVQGFEHGAIYRKTGQPGFYVTGDIRSHWNRSGFENGPYGWPVSNEIVTRSGTRYQVFEKGRLIWSPDKVVGLVPQDGPDIIN